MIAGRSENLTPGADFYRFFWFLCSEKVFYMGEKVFFFSVGPLFGCWFSLNLITITYFCAEIFNTDYMVNVSFADLCPPSVVAVRYFACSRPLSRMLFMISQVIDLMFPESSAPVVTEVICPKDLSKVDIANYRLRVQFNYLYTDSVLSWLRLQSHVNYVCFDFRSSSVILGFSFVRVRYFDTFFCVDSLGLQKRYKFSEPEKWPDFSIVKRLTGQLSDRLPGLFNV